MSRGSAAGRPWLPVAVVLLAVALRALYLRQMAGPEVFTVLVGDGAVYHDWARRDRRRRVAGTFYQAPVSRFWTGRALAWIAGHPATWLGLTVRKWMLVWNAQQLAEQAHDRPGPSALRTIAMASGAAAPRIANCLLRFRDPTRGC